MTRLTDDDRKFGPVTYGKLSWNTLRLVLSSGDEEEGEFQNTLTGYAFGWVARINLPNLIQPFRVKHIALSWDDATVARIGRNYYFETHPNEYGFGLSDGFLQIFLGPQTHDSDTTKAWCCNLPWTQWRHIRFSLYDKAGKHYWSEFDRDRKQGYRAQLDAEEFCPSVSFEFDDYDGERIVAKTHIEEREWRFGVGWFKWLSLFRKPMIRRSLDIRFSAEVGPEKGSWKGGTVGCGIDMLPGELHEAAFMRFCEKEHRSKYQNYGIKFVGKSATPI